MRLGFEVGPRTGINVPVISVIHRVRTNPEVKIAGMHPRFVSYVQVKLATTSLKPIPGSSRHIVNFKKRKE